jgi:DNA repair protein RadA/Sms
MLLAVLEKRCGLKLGSQDVFLNIAGGIKVEEPSIDLGAIAAISSSYYDVPVKNLYCFAGEVGLSGEIRPLRYLEKRISEAEKLGFNKIFISSYNKNVPQHRKNIEIVRVDTVRKLMQFLFK